MCNISKDNLSLTSTHNHQFVSPIIEKAPPHSTYNKITKITLE